jgi:cell wall-associated NlpC family hydrolase
MIPAEKVIDEAMRFTGQPYRFGAEGDTKPYEWVGPVDCSELVQIACQRAGVTPRMPDGAYYQWKHCTPIFVEQARFTYGALLFVGDGTGVGRNAITHVGFSLGDTRTFEARGRAWPVGIFPERQVWTYAGLIPGVTHKHPPISPEVTEMDFDKAYPIVRQTYLDHRGDAGDPEGQISWVQTLMAEGFEGWARMVRRLVEDK